MANVRFNLLQGKFIKITFIHQFGQFRMLTGQQCESKYWNNKTQRARGDSNFPGYMQLNYLLDTYETRIQDFYRKCLINSIVPGKKDFKAAMAGGLDLDKNILFVDFVAKLIKERSASPDFSFNTVKKYSYTMRIFDQYCSTFKVSPRVSEFDLALMTSIKDFVYKHRKYSTNSVHKFMSILKVFLSEAAKRDYQVNPRYKLFSMPTSFVLKQYLTIDELKTLKDYPFDSKLRGAVDFFLIGAFTGLRFSDFSQLVGENIERIAGVDLIRIKQAKTGGMVLIPMHSVVRELLQKYSGLPKAISQQKLNDYIKEACQIAGITQKSVHYFNRAGRTGSIVKQKFELISTHTARRSFATNAYKSGIPAMDIMRITGHRTETSFKRYICLDDEEAAIKMAGSEFFR